MLKWSCLCIGWTYHKYIFSGPILASYSLIFDLFEQYLNNKNCRHHRDSNLDRRSRRRTHRPRGPTHRNLVFTKCDGIWLKLYFRLELVISKRNWIFNFATERGFVVEFYFLEIDLNSPWLSLILNAFCSNI